MAGELNTVNIGSLTGVLETLVGQKVGRAVIRFSESAPQLEGTVLSWLQQGAETAGRSESANQQMPVFPAALRELHLAAIPNRSAANLDGSSGPDPRIHATDAEAVRAALKTAVEILPHEELLAEIGSGHPLTRLAALADGGGRLAVEDLPLVLKYADGNDPRMNKIALCKIYAHHSIVLASQPKMMKQNRHQRFDNRSWKMKSLSHQLWYCRRWIFLFKVLDIGRESWPDQLAEYLSPCR